MKTVYLVKKAISMYSYLIWTPINKISFFLNGVRFGKKSQMPWKGIYNFPQ